MPRTLSPTAVDAFWSELEKIALSRELLERARDKAHKEEANLFQAGNVRRRKGDWEGAEAFAHARRRRALQEINFRSGAERGPGSFMSHSLLGETPAAAGETKRLARQAGREALVRNVTTKVGKGALLVGALGTTAYALNQHRQKQKTAAEQRNRSYLPALALGAAGLGAIALGVRAHMREGQRLESLRRQAEAAMKDALEHPHVVKPDDEITTELRTLHQNNQKHRELLQSAEAALDHALGKHQGPAGASVSAHNDFLKAEQERIKNLSQSTREMAGSGAIPLQQKPRAFQPGEKPGRVLEFKKKAMFDAFRVELEKISAPRALKNIRGLLQQGAVGEADAMAQRYARAGALKMTDAGSQVIPGMHRPHSVLGTGMEGPAVVTVGQHAGGGGVAVRKSFDPEGSLFSRPLIQRKLEVGQRLNNNPNFAKMLSTEVGERGGAPFLHSEYVHQGEPGNVAQKRLLSASYKRVQNQVSNQPPGFIERLKNFLFGAQGQHGRPSEFLQLGQRVAKLETADPAGQYLLKDVTTNPGNYRVLPGNQPKVIDHMPLKREEAALMSERAQQHRPRQEVWGAVEGMNPPPIWEPALTEPTLERLGPGSRQPRKVRGAK